MSGGSHRAPRRDGVVGRLLGRRSRSAAEVAPETPVEAEAPPPAPGPPAPLPPPPGTSVVVGSAAADPAADTVVDAPAVTAPVAGTSAGSSRSRLLSASLWMALGTVVSRLTGFVRMLLVVAALGTSLDADVFTLANSVPNALYILVAGGVFNVVLVPQLVRAMREDRDGGDAYANRVITLGLLVLLVATVVLVVAVPVLVRAIFDGGLFAPENAGARESAYSLMRWCVPQVFFYGAFVLVGQVLNARERFGPMMWAPIANNLLSSGVLLAYLVLYGSTDGTDGFSATQEALLGGGSTLGIALQAAILVPYLRAAGFRYRPRFDFRGTGLGHTARLGAWTLAFIVANQIAFFVVNRVASGSATRAAATGEDVAGATVYQLAFLVSQVPHGIITVSVMTAVIPTLSRLSADGDRTGLRDELVGTARIVLSAIVPVAVAVACLGQAAATVLTSYGAAGGDTRAIGWTVAAFAPGMVLFCVHYLMLRGFYAEEDTRTPFLVQVWLSGTQVVVALLVGELADPSLMAVWLALGYAAAYLVGAGLSTTVLSRRVGRLLTLPVLGYLARLTLACGAAAAVMLGAWWALDAADLPVSGRPGAFALLLGGGLLGAAVYVGAALVLRVDEVRALLRAVARRG